ncbi:hypothetical protein F0L74_18935 [Chitinophaga agrisoli]|uniref:Uncharacterized protein n=1 Tax=Chitinophaga agrisoli TaxID=2607653 RepID=A0A5B2VUR8_9BACT|nr:hypothetical protein [Chitinophaga agrisoli]KAA2241936.1 hypothetical protein F0L74_18935 [Chitinophaga agrisoli]
MQHFRKAVLAITIAMGLWACQSGQQQEKGQAAATFQPAKPGGAINVDFTHEDDTSQVRIIFIMGDKTKEKSFDLPLAKDVDTVDLYRTVWDKPNSCYIGVLKQSHGTRYYHASVTADGELQILQRGTPPDTIWHYAEDVLGLGKMITKRPLMDNYTRNIQSGDILADLIVRLEPASTPDSIQLYTEFAGARKRQSFAVPSGYLPKIQGTDKTEHCIFGLQHDKTFDGVVDIKVENGRLQLTELGRVY